MISEDLAAKLSIREMQGIAEGSVVAELRARHGHSKQPESLQVLAVLQAVVEVVTAEGMNAGDPTTLFAACMSSLERPDTRSSPQVGRRFACGARFGCFARRLCVEEARGMHLQRIRGVQRAHDHCATGLCRRRPPPPPAAAGLR